MKYYIATSLLRITAHNLVIDTLKRFGHAISYDLDFAGQSDF
jgi:hypothetical protein